MRPANIIKKYRTVFISVPVAYDVVAKANDGQPTVRQRVKEVLRVRARGNDAANNFTVLKQPGNVQFLPRNFGRILHGQEQNTQIVSGAMGLRAHEHGGMKRMEHGTITK